MKKTSTPTLRVSEYDATFWSSFLWTFPWLTLWWLCGGAVNARRTPLSPSPTHPPLPLSISPSPRGATWFRLCPDVCVQKWRTWVLFQLQRSEMSDNISLKMGVNFAALLNMGKKLCWVLYIIIYKTVRMSYNQLKLYQNNQKMMDCEWPLGMIYFNLILHHNMGMKYVDEPFNMGMFFDLRRLQNGCTFRPPTHTSRHFHTGVASPPPPRPLPTHPTPSPSPPPPTSPSPWEGPPTVGGPISHPLRRGAAGRRL